MTTLYTCPPPSSVVHAWEQAGLYGMLSGTPADRLCGSHVLLDFASAWGHKGKVVGDFSGVGAEFRLVTS